MRHLNDLALALRIALFAASVPLLFRLPLRRLEGWVEATGPRREPDEHRAGEIIRLTASICRLARPLISRPCQVRGLTLYYFLRRAGVDVALVFGIGTVGGKHAGHCWLARNGEPYLENVDPRLHFTPMYTFGGGNAPAGVE